MKHPETWQAIRALLDFRNQAPPLVFNTQEAARPLAFPQQRLWFLQQLHPHSAAFHLPHLLRLQGMLNVSALAQSLNALRQRHAILRTIFKVDDQQQPAQVVLPFAPIELSKTTLGDLPTAVQERAVTDWIIANVQQPFDLAQQPGLRACLLELQTDEHLLLLVFHHIAFDFWSQSILLRELQTLYVGFCNGQEPSLPALPIQYADFAAWQCAWLGETTTQAPLLAYWQRQLADLKPLPLPGAAQFTSPQNGAAGLQKFVLSPAQTVALKTLTQQEDETLYTTLSAAFKVLLYCYTGQTDIFMAGLMANRNRRELEPLIGNFVNLLILRTDLAGNPTFRQVIARVRQTMAGAIQHQDLPIQFLNSPIRLAQVVFAFRNTPQHKITLPGLTTELEVLASGHADFDLFFDLIEEKTAEGAIITGPVIYNRDCFADETVAQLLADFAQVLALLVANPDQPLADLPLVDLSGFQNPTGLDRRKPTARPLVTSTIQPQTALEQQIAEIWQRILGVPQVDIHATFFELGASSLVLLQVHQQLQATVTPKITPVHLFQYPTIHALATYLSQQKPHPTPLQPREGTVTGLTTVPPLTRGRRGGGEIAIVGMAGRFPQAQNIAAFWQNLCAGVESLRTLTDEELIAAGVPEQIWRDPNYVRTAPVLDDIQSFDPAFFGLAPSEAKLMDPQHRLLLECAWEALEDAGYDPETYPGRIGVYAGANYSTYLLNNLLTQPDFALQMAAGDSFQLELASDKDNVATRISHNLNLKGPSLCVSTACSTSLVAVHLACQSLLTAECDMALAGAANVTVPQNRGYLYREGLIFSPDGHCRVFDAQAQGTMLGSGAGLVLLKRLEDALTDKDHIYAVIRSTAINNDGAAKIGYTAPSIEGQAGVIAAAQAIADVHPTTIGYIEAHGTATNLGDPIEITALNQVFRTSTAANQFCAIGSVKSNLGHLSKAAGIAGLIKASLALKHGLIPPSLHFSTPNPQIDFANSSFFVNTTLRAWSSDGSHPRRAGVSAFGTGGTNAHVVLEEAPVSPPPVRASLGGSGRPYHLLPLSAKDASALDELSRNLALYLQANPVALADVAYTLQTGRRHFSHRRAIVCRNQAEAMAQLALPISNPVVQEIRPKIAFLFSGQGSQRVEMGKQLYQTEPTFRQIMDRCCEILQPHLGLSLIDLLYGEDKEQADLLLNEATYAQPALFAIEYALAQLWRAWGIEPDVLVGHSMGEYAAACVAGVFSLEDGLKLISARGRLMQTSAQAGQMMAVLGSEQTVQQILQPFADQVSLAAINTTESMVISGHRDAVQAAAQALRTAGIKTKELKIFVASHSPLMEPILEEFAQVLGSVKFRRPTIQVVSNVTGKIIDHELTTLDYWLRHLRQPVRFAEGVATLDALGVNVFMEMGPAPILLGLGQECLPTAETRLWLPSLNPKKEDWAQLLTTLAALYGQQVPIFWGGFYAHERRQRVPLPTYPFQRQVCWIEPGNASLTIKQPSSRVAHPAQHPLLGRRVQSALKHKEIVFETHLSPQSPAYLGDYRVAQTVMLSATASLEMALAAGSALLPPGKLRVAEIIFHQALVLGEDEEKTIQCVLTPQETESERYAFQIFSFANDTWTQHTSGLIDLLQQPPHAVSFREISRQAMQEPCTQTLSVAAHYQKLAAQGLAYGEQFRVLENLWQGESAAIGQINLPQHLRIAIYALHPVLLEACMQILAAALPTQENEEVGWHYPIVGLDQLCLLRRVSQSNACFWGHAAVYRQGNEEELQADLHLFDEEGLLAHMTGLTLKRVAYRPTLPSHRTANGANPTHFLQQWVATPASDQRSLLLAHLRRQIADVLGLDEPERIGLRQGFFDLGLDSLLSVTLRNRLQSSLGHSFRATLIFDYPTLEALAGHVAETVLASWSQADEITSKDPQPASHAAALAAVAQLNETEVEDSLAAELAALEALLA